MKNKYPTAMQFRIRNREDMCNLPKYNQVSVG